MPHQLTGETCELKAFNQTKSTGQWCKVNITIGDTTFVKKAVTQPGDTLGWSACLSLDMADKQEGQFLLGQDEGESSYDRKTDVILASRGEGRGLTFWGSSYRCYSNEKGGQQSTLRGYSSGQNNSHNVPTSRLLVNN